MICIAVDDERLNLEHLVNQIRKVKPKAEIYSFLWGEDALHFLEEQKVDVAFLDIHLGDMSGIELAKEVRMKNPKCNIIFSTGFSEYYPEGIELHVSGYILKPITEKKVRAAFDNLLYDVGEEEEKRVVVRCFGNFEVFIDGQPVIFKRKKTKELLAYLVDRRGAVCTSKELMAALWDGEVSESNFRNIRKDLLDTLKEYSCEDIVFNHWGKNGIIVEKIDCDFYNWKEGTKDVNGYKGEYMTQYSWAEETNARLYQQMEQMEMK